MTHPFFVAALQMPPMGLHAQRLACGCWVGNNWARKSPRANSKLPQASRGSRRCLYTRPCPVLLLASCVLKGGQDRKMWLLRLWRCKEACGAAPGASAARCAAYVQRKTVLLARAAGDGQCYWLCSAVAGEAPLYNPLCTLQQVERFNVLRNNAQPRAGRSIYRTTPVPAVTQCCAASESICHASLRLTSRMRPLRRCSR
jgi:hypothetical protein